MSHYIIKIIKSKYLRRIKMQGIDDDSASSRVRSNHLFVRLGNLYLLQSSHWCRPEDKQEQASCLPYHLRTHLYFEEFLQPRIFGEFMVCCSGSMSTKWEFSNAFFQIHTRYLIYLLHIWLVERKSGRQKIHPFSPNSLLPSLGCYVGDLHGMCMISLN